MEETYIGDGVYASLEKGMIRLRTERDGILGPHDHIIYLEPEVYENLRSFAEKAWVKRDD